MIHGLLDSIGHARKNAKGGKVGEEMSDEIYALLHQQERYDVVEVYDIVMAALGAVPEPPPPEKAEKAEKHQNGELDFGAHHGKKPEAKPAAKHA